MLIPSMLNGINSGISSLSRGMNANSQLMVARAGSSSKSIKRDEC